MRRGSKVLRDAGVLATCALMIGLSTARGLADDPQPGGRLARLFRFGSTGSTNETAAARTTTPSATPPIVYATPPSPSTPPSTPDATPAGPAPRIAAQPRVSRPATESDPIVTRIAVGRSDNGGQFGMFLQVFADGTVIDSEGVHHLGPDALKPLQEALRQGELYRLKGHCGNPSTDFIVQTNVVVYERSYGKLRATSFSYSGNPHGCDASVHKLHAALEAIQAKLSTPAPIAAGSTVAPGPALTSPAPSPPPAPGVPVLGLTAPNP